MIATASATSQIATLLTAARTGMTNGALIGTNEAIRAGQAGGPGCVEEREQSAGGGDERDHRLLALEVVGTRDARGCRGEHDAEEGVTKDEPVVSVRNAGKPQRQDGNESRQHGAQAPNQASSGRQTGVAAHTQTDHSQGTQEAASQLTSHTPPRRHQAANRPRQTRPESYRPLREGTCTTCGSRWPATPTAATTRASDERAQWEPGARRTSIEAHFRRTERGS
jgi:hypothetical protein